MIKDWLRIKALRDVLQLPKIKIVILQGDKVTPGEFFFHWGELKFSLEEMKQNMAQERYDSRTHCSKIAGAILDSMNVGENALLANPILFAGIYADPRYYFQVIDNVTYNVSSFFKKGCFNNWEYVIHISKTYYFCS